MARGRIVYEAFKDARNLAYAARLRIEQALIRELHRGKGDGAVARRLRELLKKAEVDISKEELRGSLKRKAAHKAATGGGGPGDFLRRF